MTSFPDDVISNGRAFTENLYSHNDAWQAGVLTPTKLVGGYYVSVSYIHFHLRVEPLNAFKVC